MRQWSDLRRVLTHAFIAILTLLHLHQESSPATSTATKLRALMTSEWATPTFFPSFYTDLRAKF